ncbi:unnamed protein product [Didymodactylos carnosus]|nr:unnamed protein product [Didymodactylos carnosus]CAF4105017.1 unnamed protein product [Didymodactylos carnosus]
MFTGDSEGNVLKWEQTQSNLIIYSSERLLKFEATKAQLMAMVVQATSIGRNKENDEQFNSEQSHLSTSSFQKQNTSNKNSKISERQLPVYHVRNRPTGKMKNREQGVGGYVSQYTHLQKKQSTLNQTAVKSILKTIFVENYDLIIAASEDTNIYVWGYDSEALHALIILRDQLDDTHEGAQVANRVSGFTLRHIFSQHNSLVTSIALIDDVETFGDVFLISAGWDRRICTWNLTHFMLNSIFYNSNATTVEEAEIASPGSILDLAYSPSLKYFAYSTSDQSVYVRKFSTKGYDMDLMYALKSQQDIDITCIRWNYITNQWITGCEDGSIQLWDSAGEFKHTINVRGSVHAITIDYVQKVLLIGAEDTLKVYDMKDYTCLQTNMGHSDIIRDIVFIPERDQYITVSWDKTMRIWNAWSPILLKQQVKIVDPKTQLAQQLWEKLHGFVEQSGVIDDDANTIVEKYFQRQQTFHYNSDEQSRQISSVTK